MKKLFKVFFSIAILMSYNSFGQFTHYIGEQFGGGVIFNLWKDSQGLEHGLVVALTDQDNYAPWDNGITPSLDNKAQSSWDGLANSKEIVEHEAHTNSAAKLCLDLVSGGFNDWYLPSIQELSTLWSNYNPVARSLSKIQGAKELAADLYWSSSDGKHGARAFNFSNGTGLSSYKLDGYHVRAIRSF